MTRKDPPPPRAPGTGPVLAQRLGAPRPATPRKAAPRKQATSKKRGALGRILFGILGLIGWIIGKIWWISWRLVALAGLIIGGISWYYSTTLPPAMDLIDGRARGSVTMFDRYGEVFAWRGERFGGAITASTVSKHLKNAVIATEDKRFYSHFGVSPRGVASAVRINLREGRGPLSGHGGSTLSQQTAKLLCLGVPYDPQAWDSEAAYEAECRRGTIQRKVKEALYALGMEIAYTKDEILTIYLNRAFLGSGARGFEAAAQRYFNTSAANVSPAQAAMLAGLLVAPTRYAPTNSLKRAQERSRVVVTLMEEQGYLTAAQAAEARNTPAVLSKAAARRAGGYFADWVMSTGPDYFTRTTTEDVIIRTTLDPRIQTAAEAAITDVFANKVREGSKAQAAIVVMSADGAVRAMVGGRDTKASGAFNRAAQARRQTGSVFKPFVYATALELGYSPNDTVLDEPVTYNVPGSGAYSPRNFNNKFAGPVTLTQALSQSLNVPAVKVSEAVGRNLVRRVAEDFGIRSELAQGPALALGASESTLVEMVGAYAGILNGGSSVKPYGLAELRLQGDAEPLAGAGGGVGERVISEDAARKLTYMMHQVIETGTGRRAQINGIQIAGKTGTSQSARDAWFIGFTSEYVTGVWMGYDDNTPLKGVTGSGLPTEIWRTAMAQVHAGSPPPPLPMTQDTPRQATAPQQAAPQPQPTPRQETKGVLDVLIGILGGN